jgi:hypothetical protein
MIRDSGHWIYSLPVRGYIGTNPHLDLQVSPPGYPPVGNFWRINVYIVNETSGGPIFQPGVNSTVVVTLSMNGWPEQHELQTDQHGIASFQFLSQYTDIAFEAHHPQLPPSHRLVLSSYYVSPEVVDTFLTYNAFSVLGTLGSGFLISSQQSNRLRVWRKLRKWVLVVVFCLFSFVTLVSAYARLFQSTPWGYPENIVGSFITFSLIKSVFYGGLALFVGFWSCNLATRACAR